MRAEHSRFFGTNEADTKVLFALLEGHAYALLLAKRFLEHARGQHVRKPMQHLEEVLFGCAPEKRIWRLIEEILARLDDKRQGFALPLLERLAVFMTPVTSQILDVCYADMQEEVTRAHPGIPVPGRKRIVDELVASSLLSQDTCDTTDRLWTVPPTAKS